MEGMTPSGTPAKTGSGALRWTLMVLTLMAALVVGLALSQTPAAAQDQGETQNYAGDTIAPKIKGVSLFSLSNSPYRAGDVVSVRVIFDDLVYSNGPSHLIIRVGDTEQKATNPGRPQQEATRALVYSYRIQEGESDADGVSVPPGRIMLESCTYIRDEDNIEGSYGSQGNHAMLHYDGLNHDSDHKVDAVPPTVSGIQVADAPGGGPYGAGDEIVVTATFSEPVNISGGNPAVTIQVGSADRTAAFKEQAADKRSIKFAYLVKQGDADTDGVSVNADSIGLPENAAIRDAAGNDANLSHGEVAANANATVDAAPPTATGLSVATTGTYAIGGEIRFSLAFNKAVQVSGTPSLQFNAGTETRQAAYSATSGNSITFAYRVQEGDSAPSGLSVGADSVSLPEGASVTGAKGLNATLDHPAVPASASQAIDGVRPTIRSLAMAGASGVRTTGDSLAVAATFTEDVSVTGQPSISLTVGATPRTATYSGTAPGDASRINFAYTVTQDDRDTDGVSVAKGSIALPEGASIRDGAGNAADPAHPALSHQSTHKVDQPYTVTGLSFSQGPETVLGIGDTATVTASFSGSSTVGGTPEISLSIGDGSGKAVYAASASDGRSATFEYQVAEGDEGAVSAPAGSIQLPNGASVTGDNTLAVALGHSGATGGPTVDGVRPTVTAITVAGEGKTYDTGDRLVLNVQTSEAVTIGGGKPSLTLRVGNANRTADYSGSESGSSHQFAYTVVDGEADNDGVSVPAGQLALNGATMTDAAGNAADTAHQGMAADSSHKVSAGPAAAGSVSVVGEPKHYGAGDTLSVAVEFDEQVKVSGQPTIALQIGGAERTAKFQRVSGKKVVFGYTVAGGDNDANGVSVNAGDIALPGNASMVSAQKGTGVLLSHPAMPDQADHVVDTRRPEYDRSEVPNGFAFVGAGSQPKTFAAGSEIFLSVYFDEPVEVRDKPTIRLTIGDNSRTAEYAADGDRDCVQGTNYCRVLTFRYLVAVGDFDDDGVEVEAGTIRYPERRGSIRDQAGNKARVDHNGWSSTNNPRVDAVLTPELVRVTMTGNKSVRKPGDPIFAWAKFNAPVKITGTPVLTFRIGDGNQYQDMQSEWARAFNGAQSGILFRMTLPAGLSDTDGISFPANPITLGEGGTVTSLEGKVAILTLDETEANDGYRVSPTK